MRSQEGFMLAVPGALSGKSWEVCLPVFDGEDVKYCECSSISVDVMSGILVERM